MSRNNKVVWSEGMFLRPHHFQQHVRYLENYIEGRCADTRSYTWGFKELQLDQQLLGLGKIAISAARGVFPDGTPFNIPVDDEPPLPLEVVYKNRTLEKRFRLDLLVANRVVVECKAVDSVIAIHLAQCLTQLRITNKKLGLVVNFGEKYVKDGIHRVVNGL